MRDTDFQEVDPALAQEFKGFGSMNQPASKGEVVTISTQDTIITAQKVAVERNLTLIMNNLKVLARMAGDNYYYAWSTRNRDGTKGEVMGPTIKLANDVAREYGNCVVGADARDIGDHWLIAARFVDLQTGYSLTRLFQQRKSQSVTKNAERDLDIAFQIGQSKAIRNVVTNALQSFTDFALEEAKKSLVERFGKDLPGYRDMAIERLTEMGIALDRVERLLGRAPTEWTAKDLARISANLQGIRDGMSTIDDTFPASGGANPPSAGGESSTAKSPPPVKGAETKPAETKPVEEKQPDPPKAKEPEQKVEAKKEEPKPEPAKQPEPEQKAPPAPKQAEPDQQPLLDDKELDIPEGLKRDPETGKTKSQAEKAATAKPAKRAPPAMAEPEPEPKQEQKPAGRDPLADPQTYDEFIASLENIVNTKYNAEIKGKTSREIDTIKDATLTKMEAFARDRQPQMIQYMTPEERKKFKVFFDNEWSKFL